MRPTDPFHARTANDEMEDFIHTSMEGRVEVETVGEMEAMQLDNEEDTAPSADGSTRLSRRKPMSVANVAAVLGCTEKTVREMRKKEKLKTPSAESNLITVSSVNAVLSGRQQRTQKVQIRAG